LEGGQEKECRGKELLAAAEKMPVTRKQVQKQKKREDRKTKRGGRRSPHFHHKVKMAR